MHLSDPLTPARLRTTEPFIQALRALGVRSVQDLLLLLPRGYEDLSQLHTLAQAQEGQKVTLRGIVSHVKLIRLRGRKTLVQATLTDGDGNSCAVLWFNQPHIKRMIPEETELVLTGKIGRLRGKLTLQSPVFERGDRRVLLHSGRLVPIYPEHSSTTSEQARISTRWLREKMALVRGVIKELPETLPRNVLMEEKLLRRAEAIEELHFPSSGACLQEAQERIAFEELYHLQMQALERKREWQALAQERLKIPMNIELIRAFFRSLRFTPTPSQKIAIYEILRDLERLVPMSRLLEGDVGSGKTLVAVAVMANVVAAGGQCALMVPTEVLAKQHAEEVSKLLLNFHRFLQQQNTEANEAKKLRSYKLPSVALLTGSTPSAEANRIKQGLATGTIDIVIGTHALIQGDVTFKDLRLAIVDEQHRFGVEQRKRLKEVGSPPGPNGSVRAGPHFLSMTATPIPRTLALTAYGDHDLSVLLEKPGNRKPIKTKVIPPSGRRTIELFIDREIAAGRQVYVICPLIKESTELADVRNVTEEARRLQEVFPRRNISFLHGQLRPEEKDCTMRDFKERHTDILVSTSVIEVGIDVPNASIILIEGAERFGLAQLHQLRGRVGRADHQSYCFLCTTDQGRAHSDRLKAMERFTDGFRLAEIDLRLRGPGEIYGTRQSGLPEIRVGALTNPALVMRARRAAERTLGVSKSEAILSASP